MIFVRNLSIKNKLIALVLFVSITAIVLGFSTIIITDIIQLRRDLVNDTRIYAALVGEYCIGPLAFDTRGEAKDLLEKLEKSPSVEYAFLFTEKGDLYATYTRGTLEQPLQPPRYPDEEFYEFKDDYLHVSLPIVFKGKRYGGIYVVSSTRLLMALTRTRIFSLILVMSISILISYLLARRYQRPISLPILKLAEVTELISDKTDYSIRVQSPGNDEIGTLYHGFNNMLDKIQLWERKRDEAEAAQQRLLVELEQKNKELEQVVYVTSHDLRSPLVNIQGFGQELNYSLKEVMGLIENYESAPHAHKAEIMSILKDDILESLKYINSSTTKMDSLLSGLLKLSRVGRMSTTFETVDMNQLMAEVSNSFEFHLKECGGHLHVEPDLPSCFGCELEINQVFSNLISNAIKYRDPARNVEIHFSGEATADGTSVVYRIQDNGIGIPKDYQHKIFEIFHRLKPEDVDGEGLGLAIVNKIVHRHNGRIDVQSVPNEGSTFTISLSPIGSSV